MYLATLYIYIYTQREYYELGHPFSQYSSAKRRCSWRFSRGPMSMSVPLVVLGSLPWSN